MEKQLFLSTTHVTATLYYNIWFSHYPVHCGNFFLAMYHECQHADVSCVHPLYGSQVTAGSYSNVSHLSLTVLHLWSPDWPFLLNLTLEPDS